MTKQATLERNQVDIYILLSQEINEQQRKHYKKLLSAEENKRYDDLKNIRVKQEYLLTRGFIRTKLSAYLKVQPNDLSFAYNGHGKPELITSKKQPNLRFNISHTKGLICLAVTLQNNIGIDVEDITRKNTPLAIAHRFFSPREVEELYKVPKKEKNNRFFDLWTLKETYIKARGTGLTLPLSKFTFSFQAKNPEVSFKSELNDNPSQWSFRLYSPTKVHRLALGVKTPLLSKVHIETVSEI